MDTTIPGDELHYFRAVLRSLFEDLPLGIRYVLKGGKLIILGQHRAEVAVDSQDVLNVLEQQLRSLPIWFAHQVSFYLRVLGEKQPYAYRHFRVQPPAPPPNPYLCSDTASEVATAEQPSGDPVSSEQWLVGDEELDELMQELMTPASSKSSITLLRRNPDYAIATTTPAPSEVSLSLVPVSPSELATRSQQSFADQETENPWHKGLNRRLVLTTGITALGLAGGAYVLTRPCTLGSCEELQTARTLGEESVNTVHQARSRRDLETAQQYLARAVVLLDRIPLWSGRSQEAQNLMETYQGQAIALEQIIAMEDQAAIALQRSQNPPYPVETWEALQNLWQTLIDQAENIEPNHEFYGFAQGKLQDYRTQLFQVEQQLAIERQAQQMLENAQQTIQLAEARQRIARSLENWQLVRATWQVVLLRLEEIPAQTLAIREAERLQAAYQPRLESVMRRVEQEQTAAQLLTQATQQADQAETAADRHDWLQALTRWDQAILYIQDVPSGTSAQEDAETLMSTYQVARAEAQQKLQATEQVELELAKICRGEIQVCQLISVASSIRIQLGERYVEAIAAARDSGNPDLQALVTEHQLNLRQVLERLAQQFQLPVEVYDPANVLLDRHTP